MHASTVKTEQGTSKVQAVLAMQVLMQPAANTTITTHVKE
jgi:hypothetical protein